MCYTEQEAYSRTLAWRFFILFKHLHYSWIICLSGLLLIFLTMGMVNNGFSVFLPYLRDTYGFSNTETSLLINLRCAASIALAMLMIFLSYHQVKKQPAGE